MTRAISLVTVLLAGCATTEPTVDRADVAMVREVSAMTGLAYRGDILPTVEIVSRARMDRIAGRSRDQLAQSCAAGGVTENCAMFAGYNPALNRIVVAADIAPADQCAALAHEITHFLQMVNGRDPSEPAAYALQADWEARHPDGCTGAKP